VNAGHGQPFYAASAEPRSRAQPTGRVALCVALWIR
jgi:hypothetical protein